jgi:imidazolonepropionase-like amidohydrolase
MTVRKIILSTFSLCLATSLTAQTEPYPSTYERMASSPVLIVNATILTGTGERIGNGSLLISEGRIEQIGDSSGSFDTGAAKVIDAGGRWVTPGIIDVHSHLGVYASPGIEAHSDGNEATSPVTARVWAEHSVWPQDPGFNRARAGGITA